MADRTIFDEIVEGTIPSWKVWEDEKYLAFLTPFPSTPGLTVVIPKKNPGDYIFGLDVETSHGLIDAATKVAKILEKALGVARVGLIFEGTGVAHVHAKLYPMHGDVDTFEALPKHLEFYPHYAGYLTSIEGPRMDDAELTELQRKVQEAAIYES
jgi:diadenosine tetraphosphate (Ap4A) HIT family hydrolase